MGQESYIFEVIHETVVSNSSLNVSVLCDLAGVSRSGYYAWLKAEPLRQQREEEDRADFELILEAYQFRGYAKGARSIYMRLIHRDPPVIMNLKKIRRLMHKYGLKCPIRKANPYRRMAKAMKTSNYADNLLQREFECYGPRMVLETDITYIPYTLGFAYFSTILDAYTKQILSYVVSDSLEVEFVKETVEKLVRDHGVSLHAETIIHSDQGSHYTSTTFIKIVSDAGLRRSMSRRGNCWDNAPQESFFGHMKDAIADKIATYDSYDAVKAEIDDYIHYYNTERYDWDLCKLAPDEFYKFVTTGVYPLAIPNPPAVPVISKKPEELGVKKDDTN